MKRLLRTFAWVLVAAFLIFGLLRVRFDTDVLNALPANVEAVEGLKIFQQHFSKGQELIIALEADSADNAESAAERIAELLQTHSNLVSSVAWKAPWVAHPDEATEFTAFLWLNQPPEVFSTLTNQLSLESAPEFIAAAKEQLTTSLSPTEIGMRAYDPFSLLQLPDHVTASSGAGFSDDPFASVDGKFRMVTVDPATALLTYRDCRAWLASIKEIVANSRKNEPLLKDVTTGFTGRAAFVAEISMGMERDMAGTSAGTLLVIAALFYFTHRRLLPLLWLIVLLVTVLAAATALGGFLFGMVNVMSIGFASILLGLAEDFGIVLYQESQTHPDHSVKQIRREAAPGILWSAVTASGAFLALNLSSLPGLRQLGTFVAVGILVAAALMLLCYLQPIEYAEKRFRSPSPHSSATKRFLLFETSRVLDPRGAWAITAAILLVAAAALTWRPPQFDRSPDPLRPKASEAYDVAALLKQRLGKGEEPLWVITRGADEAQVSERLKALKQHLQTNPSVDTFTAPDAIWPNPANQQANRATLAPLLLNQSGLETLALNEGFTPDALGATRKIFAAWKTASAQTNVYWPTGSVSRWVLEKVAARTDAESFALTLVYPKRGSDGEPFIGQWPNDFRSNGILLSGWELLGGSVFDLVMKELPRILIPVFLLVVLCLALAFRNVCDVLLSLGLLAFSLVTLNAVMTILGWEWNILNLMALPMLLGMGIDFSIHVQLALSKAGGDLIAVRRSIGKALLLAGATTVAGFGSLAFSSNAGIASLGATCALGIIIALLTAVYLLPTWWQRMHSR